MKRVKLSMGQWQSQSQSSSSSWRWTEKVRPAFYRDAAKGQGCPIMTRGKSRNLHGKERVLAGKASRSTHAKRNIICVEYACTYRSASTAMASLRVPSASFLEAFLPVVRARLLPQEEAIQRLPLVQQIPQLRLKASLIPAALAPTPTLLGELWDGLLKAVPKKKTSHMKKRHRQMAGKALKDVTALNKCSACGRLKRAHILCPYCVQSMFEEQNC